MKLSKKQKTAVEKSVKHWEDDIIQHFVAGDRIDKDVVILWWKRLDERLKVFSDDCPLCKLVKTSCRKCPYFIYYERSCDDDGHWTKFTKHPTLKNAIAMRDALKKVIEGAEE